MSRIFGNMSGRVLVEVAGADRDRLVPANIPGSGPPVRLPFGDDVLV